MRNLLALADQPKAVFLGLALISIALLSLAIVSEYLGAQIAFFGNQNLSPCPYCTVQRFPHAMVAIIGLAGVLMTKANRKLEIGLLLGVLAMILIFGTLFALHHMGVEYRFWQGSPSCSGGLSLEVPEQGAIVLGGSSAPVPDCRDATWRFPGSAGLSMAGWNFFISGAMAALASRAAIRAIPRLPKGT